jgi:hypothetical protein
MTTRWTVEPVTMNVANVLDETGYPVAKKIHTQNAESIVRDHNEAQGLRETLHALAMMGLQSERYVKDVEYREAVDNGLTLLGLTKAALRGGKEE